ncbi:hypothetical protein CONPUDRAFT_164118 [Coniophora puteana RWD-64-598 SS2]|uniref:Uncharacterized protein n=1 Tax=Coniophora puteana (strain RWD-64-598) TaxID=741705 RepID=A0A5M3MVP6_CONPW|nr:uncharacterized protein CONPUDRAFT_164118 [Coniophora puteana RWD-64-598 SS2]EIW83120.1 hypothetical protein CONPUDRAFT_164118 [Coniophora puteana RWD-64-598 SS2]
MSRSPSVSPSQSARIAPPPRPSSRSEQLLRNTLRKDDAIRSRAPTTLYDDDDCECENLDALISRHRRNSAASASSSSSPPPRNPRTVYTTNDDEQNEYAQLIRSNSAGASSRRPTHRSRQSLPDSRTSLSYIGQDQYNEKTFASAQLHSRLTRAVHQPQHDSLESSPPSSPRSFLNSRSNSRGTMQSDSTGITVPEKEEYSVNHPSQHRYGRSYSSAGAHAPMQAGTSSSPSQLRTPSSPWHTIPLPPSPPAPSQRLPSMSPVSKRRSAIGDSFSMHKHPHARVRTTPGGPQTEEFDAQTALLACRDLQGYVSFANVAGLGAPADLDMTESPIEQRSQPWVMRVMRSVF